jgi:DNA polymerase III epsilon subunit-like protein
MMNTYDITQHYEVATALLSAEEAAPPVSQFSDWQARQRNRVLLAERLSQLGQAVSHLQRRVAALPTLARREHLHWAQALLAFPNLAFLEVDTDGLDADADIVRLAVIDQTGAVLYDQLVQPRRPISPKIAHLTGLTQERLSAAPRLVEVWEQVQAALAGRYVLSFNLEFDQQQLTTKARRCDLPLLTFIGECLMLRAQEYYAAAFYPKLADLCERLGYPLPDHPHQDALDRARGQVHLLRAMAQGITHAQPAHQVADEAESRESGDPFLPDFPDESE